MCGLMMTMGNNNNNNPMLYEKHRRTIGANFMKTLCERDHNAIQNGLDNYFTIDDLWEHLRGFNQQQISHLVIRYFQNDRHYIMQHPDGRISLTDVGRQHCNDRDEAFRLPENYQPL